MTKLPSFTDAWKEWQDVMAVPYLATEEISRDFRTSLDTFDRTRAEKEKELEESSLRMQHCFNIWKTLGMGIENDTGDDEGFHSKATKDFAEAAAKLQLDGFTRSLDKRITGGAFTVETEAQRKHISSRFFQSLALSPWSKLSTGSRTVSMDVIRHLFYPALMTEAFRRVLRLILYAMSVTTCTPLEIAKLLQHRRYLHRFLIPETIGNQSCEFFASEVAVAAIREGRRWKFLIDLFGLEIILLDKSSSKQEGEKIAPLFDVPRAVASYSDEKFSQIKDVLSTNCGWLTDTCHKLKGLLHKILEWNITDDAHISILLGREIRNRIKDTFESPEIIMGLPTSTSGQKAGAVFLSNILNHFSRNGSSNISSEIKISSFLFIAMALPALFEDRNMMGNKTLMRQKLFESLVKNDLLARKISTARGNDWCLKLIDMQINLYEQLGQDNS